jgi:hypothetical protein
MVHNEEALSTASPSALPSTGATFNPMYLARRPMMWAISETDLRSMSVLNVIATYSFSIGAFLAGWAMDILISYGASNSALSPVADFLLHKCTFFLGALALASFGLGVIVTVKKGSILDQIKKETTPSG